MAPAPRKGRGRVFGRGLFAALLPLLLHVLVISDTAAGGRDLYGILGVAKTATKKEIKKAFRQLALKYHPDRNPNDETAKKKFEDLGFAYETLGDKELRQRYDRGGEEAVKDGHNTRGGGAFDNMFGSFFNFGGQREREVPKGDLVKMQVDVTLEQIFNGAFIELLRAKPVPKEAEGTRECNCQNKRMTRQVSPGRFQIYQQRVCDECPNVKLTMEWTEMDVEIDIGMVDGHEITFVGDGEPHIDGENGDLVMTVNTLRHPRYWRVGSDLYTNVTISLHDALVGFAMSIKQLDGSVIELPPRTGVTKPGYTMTLLSEGMPHYDDNTLRGSLHITFDVQFPEGTLAAAQLRGVSELFAEPAISPVAYRGM